MKITYTQFPGRFRLNVICKTTYWLGHQAFVEKSNHVFVHQSDHFFQTNKYQSLCGVWGDFRLHTDRKHLHRLWPRHMTAEWSRHLQRKLGEVKSLDNQYAWWMHCGLRLADGGMRTRRLVSSVFDKSSYEEMSEMSCNEFPVRTKPNQTKQKQQQQQQQNLQGKEGRKFITAATNNYVQFSSNISLNSWYKHSSTNFKQHLLTDVTGKYFQDL